MEQITGNEPTFARIASSQNGTKVGPQEGLTIRQYYAGLAMQGLCANSIPGQHHAFPFLANEAVQYADALIAELNKPTNQ